ncbi:MAG: TonB-dependent receptor [Candidatus Scalindua rubra]|uniref:TonB-dependent receptor-like beta-barrel domain-containing protein n=1 Tax=Candidatus Scalindua brodae TaxID=237368 RepID=A0A0B0EHQ1_9BACT|nr:MAG: hypothetical protein SCABRO_01655 [Candidatus Scalindua brodae]MBZ0109184.1 TonB-dependent receptor [Candidatus Scalindua rubra]TWU28969.1 hypothetical protein S225a_26790 [Candidatus Brocadiaceae bacterium S225]
MGRVSYSLSQYHYETDGFRKNNNLNQDIYDAFVQISLSHKTSIQAEYRYFDDQRGDLSLRFDPDNFDRLSQKRQTDTLRLGFRHSFTPYSETIASFIYQNSDLDTRLTDPDIPVSSTTTLSDGSILRLTGASVGLGTHLDENSWTGEIRHLFQSKSGRFYITAGVGRFNSDRKNNFTTNGSYTGSLQPFPPLPIFSPVTLPESSRVPEDNDIRHTNFYIYSLIKPPKLITSTIGDMTWTIGGCMDFFEGQGKEKTDQFNPKFGLTWNPFPGTTIRGALFRTLKRQLVSNQTIEPTQVAGFNQFFDDTNGTIGWRYGIAIDQKFSKSLYAGAEFSRRDLDVVKGDLRTNSVTYARFGHDEDLIRTYLNWTPELFEKNWLSMSAEYQYEWIDKEPGLLDIELFEKLRTHRVPLGINFFHPSGFSARLKSTYVDQAGRFADTPTRMTTVPGHDNFWYFDGSISYRLPKRHGIISIGAQNLFNKNFNFQDTDPTHPQIVPEQLIFARFTLSL